MPDEAQFLCELFEMALVAVVVTQAVPGEVAVNADCVRFAPPNDGLSRGVFQIVDGEVVADDLSISRQHGTEDTHQRHMAKSLTLCAILPAGGRMRTVSSRQRGQ